MACFRKVVTPGEKRSADERPGAALDTSNQQQYHLWLHKEYHYLPLTRLQATKVNAAILAREPPERFLSPGQVALLRRMQKLRERDWRALDDWEPRVVVDRSPEGLPAYEREIEKRVTAAE